MADPIKITPEEFQSFQSLKNEVQKNMFELGALYYEKVELDILYKQLSDKEGELRNKISEFKKKESELMDSILQKYGEGNLNVKEGIFVPTQKTA